MCLMGIFIHVSSKARALLFGVLVILATFSWKEWFHVFKPAFFGTRIVPAVAV